MKKKLFILTNENGVGGTITILNELKKIYNVEVINIYKLRYLKKGENILAIQPKSILKLLLLSMVKNCRDYYLFDTHPCSLGLIKGLVYRITAIILLSKTKRCIIPAGPLASLFPFNKFIKINWYNFVTKKFEIICKNDNNKFIYLGTISKKKYFQNFIIFIKKNKIQNLSIYGYLINTNLIPEIFFKYYKGIYKSDIVLNEKILVWTSIFESYGLIFREFIESGGKVLCLREPNKYDLVQDGIYICDSFNSDYYELILSLLEIANQKNLKEKFYDYNLIEEIIW